MTNKTPIVVLTGLGIVATAAVAGLTRDHWMGSKPAVVATAPEAAKAPEKTPDQPAATAPEAPKATEQPAATEPPAAPAQQAAATEQPAATAPQPAAEAPKTEPAQQTAAAQPDQPAATNAADKPKVPAFDTVRVEKTGEAVIAGTAAAGSEVVVLLDGKPIGETTANSDGAFVVVPDKPLPAGSGALTIEAKGKADAQPVESEQSVAVIVPAAEQKQEALVAIVSPDQPTKVLQKPEPAPEAAPAATPAAQPEAAPEKPAKLVSIDAVDYDPAGNIVFSGQGEKGNTARIYIDNAFIGDSPVGDDGKWTFSGTAQVAPGVHTLRVDGLDSAGKVLNRVEVPFFREEQNKVADASKPAEPAATTTTTQAAPATAEAKPADAAAPAASQPEATPASQPEATPASQPEATPAAQPEAAPAKQPEAAASATQPAAAPATQPEAAPATQPEAVPAKQPEAAPATQPEAVPAKQPEAAPAKQPEVAATAPAAQPAATPEATAPAATAAATPAGTEKPKEGRIVIQPGNNLWRISRVLYGTGSRFTMLYEANKDQIRNPNRIYPGQVFRTPEVAPKAGTIDPKRRDTLAPEENEAGK